MNFKLFICSNCKNEEENDSFLNFLPKNSNGLYKNNNTDINLKSILSSSDNNNNSTNNLEIIEYPYSNNCNDNDDYIPKPIPSPVKSSIIKKKYEYDDFLNKIKPPKLFNEGSKAHKNEIKIPKLNNEDKQIKEIIIDDKNTKKNPSKNSFLINNEDNLQNNKEFLNNYNSKNNSFENDNKKKENKIIEKENNEKFNGINNNIINHNKKISNNISGVKVDFPCPDIANFLVKNCNESKISNIENNEIDEKCDLMEGNNISKKEEKEKLFKSKTLIQKKINKINLKKNKKQIINKNHTYNKLNKTEKKEGKTLIKFKLNNKKFKIKKNPKYINEVSKNSKPIASLKIIENNPYKKDYGIKTEINNKSMLINPRARYLSNAFLGDLLLSKSSFKFRNTYSNFIERKKKNIFHLNNSNIKIDYNQSTIYSSKTYVNPFSSNYQTKKKSFIF